MLSATEYLTNMQCTVKLHESMLKSVCETYELTLMEGNVISFLHNNPGKDTAADIVELRMLCKQCIPGSGKPYLQKASGAHTGHQRPAQDSPLPDPGGRTHHPGH